VSSAEAAGGCERLGNEVEGPRGDWGKGIFVSITNITIPRDFREFFFLLSPLNLFGTSTGKFLEAP